MKARERIIAEKGSLAETNPELIMEWDYDKNTITPNNITAGSGKKVYWKCKTCGYNWEASIDHRVNGRGCPVCTNRIIIPGHNDLASQRPNLMKEWDCDNNLNLDPTHLALGSGKKAHWKCSICGNEWQATIVSRTRGRGCPACFARRRKAGLNKKKQSE